ncbi:MAG: DUF5752 family protein [Candidatus Hydrothermarchaeales archaeon]
MADGPNDNEFVFQRGFYLIELTGKKAKNLKEFLNIVREIDETSIFYHMYHSLLEHHFVIPEYFNDFAYWLEKELHEDVLAEKLANIGVYGDGGIESLRSKLVDTLEERLKVRKKIMDVPEGEEFHFVRSRYVILPTKYRARNLEEFLKCMRKIDNGTLFYHFFESRLRPKKEGVEYPDDFSAWIFDSLGLQELADRLAKIDFLGYTLDGIRKEIIKIVEGA